MPSPYVVQVFLNGALFFTATPARSESIEEAHTLYAVLCEFFDGKDGYDVRHYF